MDNRITTVQETSRIEQLPDHVLLLILSLLPTLAEISRTAVLSRRWRFLCHNITRLDFDSSTLLLDPYWDRPDSYISWINSVIESREAVESPLPLVKDLLVRYDLNKKHRHHIDRWVKFAIASRVENLHLHLGGPAVHREQQYKLSGKLWHTVPSGLKCLKSLFLKHVKVGKKFVEFILSNCPLLEDLSLDFARSSTHLDFSGREPPLRLKRLQIRLRGDSLPLTTLCAPYLTSFHYVSLEFSPQMIHVPMLTDLTIGGYGGSPPINYYLELLWNYMPQLTRLELIMTEPQDFKFVRLPKLVKLRYLKMELLWNNNSIFKEIIKFISVCPLLETFALQLYFASSVPDRPLPDSEQRKKNQEMYRKLEKNCVFESLKALELYGADGKTINLEIVECIISKSPNLKKLMVDTGNPYGYPKRTSRHEIVKVAIAEAELLCRGRYPEIEIKVIG